MIEIEDFIDGDRFESISDFSFGGSLKEPKEISQNTFDSFFNSFSEKRIPIIYISSDRVTELFKIVDDIKTKDFILVSHNGDTTFDDPSIKKPKSIIKWFGQNINFKNTEEIISLPIGLERQIWSQSRYGFYGYKHKKIYEFSKKKLEKNKICYINFDPTTNITKRGWIEPFFRDKNWCHIRMGGIFGNLDTYFTECLESLSVLCPDGNGIDCHRNWEMLYLGVIPVIQTSQFHEEVYKDLPVILVSNFKNLSEEVIVMEYKKLKSLHLNFEKLKFSYWENLIKTSSYTNLYKLSENGNY